MSQIWWKLNKYYFCYCYYFIINPLSFLSWFLNPSCSYSSFSLAFIICKSVPQKGLPWSHITVELPSYILPLIGSSNPQRCLHSRNPVFSPLLHSSTHANMCSTLDSHKSSFSDVTNDCRCLIKKVFSVNIILDQKHQMVPPFLLKHASFFSFGFHHKKKNSPRAPLPLRLWLPHVACRFTTQREARLAQGSVSGLLLLLLLSILPWNNLFHTYGFHCH